MRRMILGVSFASTVGLFWHLCVPRQWRTCCLWLSWGREREKLRILVYIHMFAYYDAANGHHEKKAIYLSTYAYLHTMCTFLCLYTLVYTYTHCYTCTYTLGESRRRRRPCPWTLIPKPYTPNPEFGLEQKEKNAMTAEIQTLRKQVEIAENEVRNLIPRPSTLNRKP